MRRLATAATERGIEAAINRFWCSTLYRVDPATLAITNASRPVPEGFGVRRLRGDGFEFYCER